MIMNFVYNVIVYNLFEWGIVWVMISVCFGMVVLVVENIGEKLML